LGKFLSVSFFYFLNSGNGIRISGDKNYKSVPDLSLNKTLNIEWYIDEDPKGSDHLPIIIKNFGNPISRYLNRDVHKGSRLRPILALGNFDKRAFSVILQKRLEVSPIDFEGEDLLQAWYNLVMESAILSGAIVYDGDKKYSKNDTVVSVLNSKNSKET